MKEQLCFANALAPNKPLKKYFIYAHAFIRNYLEEL